MGKSHRGQGVKRYTLQRHLRRHGCRIEHEGREHTIWINLVTGRKEAVPRQTEIKHLLARKICRKLGIPDPPG